jgi:hypothetical protein
MIKAKGSPPGTPPRKDLTTDLYSSSTLAAHYDEMFHLTPATFSDH